jgi:hypothetical protein
MPLSNMSEMKEAFADSADKDTRWEAYVHGASHQWTKKALSKVHMKEYDDDIRQRQRCVPTSCKSLRKDQDIFRPSLCSGSSRGGYL